MDTFALLKERFPRLALCRDFSFARHTTIGCGGMADVAAFPQRGELAPLACFLKEANIPYCLLGAGANVLAADGRFHGVVVKFSRMNSLFAEGNTLIADAGVTGGSLLRAACACNLKGLHFLTGIPMSVGGATAMNAGVRGRHLSDVLVWAEALLDGKLVRIPQKECQFSEKSSVFLQKIAISRVCLAGTAATEREIAAEREYYRNLRAHLPKGRSMGCVFVNPEGESAGALIERCGLKERRIGGAVVSSQHANFILSEGATSSDVAALIELVRQTVFAETGILLREEIRRLP